MWYITDEDRRQFWESAVHDAFLVTNETLGVYLSTLVKLKRERYPSDHSELLACGMRAVQSALRLTDPTIGVFEESRALVLLQLFQWVGWSAPGDTPIGAP